MTDTQPTAGDTGPCPICGTPLVTLTADFADVPDHPAGNDAPRAELNPGQMAQQTGCPNPDCPGPSDGAVL